MRTVLSEIPPNSSLPPQSPGHDVAVGTLSLPRLASFPFYWPRWRSRQHGIRTAEAWEQYLFPYVSDNGLTFLVMADNSIRGQTLFTFLNALQELYSTYESTVISNLPASDSDELSTKIGALVHEYNTNPPQDPTQNGFSNDAGLTVYHHEQWNSKGRKIELLGDNTYVLSGQT